MAKTVLDKAIKIFLDIERGRKSPSGGTYYGYSNELNFLNDCIFDSPDHWYLYAPHPEKIEELKKKPVREYDVYELIEWLSYIYVPERISEGNILNYYRSQGRKPTVLTVG